VLRAGIFTSNLHKVADESCLPTDPVPLWGWSNILWSGMCGRLCTYISVYVFVGMYACNVCMYVCYSRSQYVCMYVCMYV